MRSAEQHADPGQFRSEQAHEVLAVMNSLRNPRLAAIYLLLVTSNGTVEEIEEARQLIADASTKKD